MSEVCIVNKMPLRSTDEWPGVNTVMINTIPGSLVMMNEYDEDRHIAAILPSNFGWILHRRWLTILVRR